MPSSDCRLAREAASARLDGEVSELDSARLDVHLAACEECAAYAAGIAAVSQRLQAAALEPAPQGLFAARRRPLVRVQAAAAAALVLAAVGTSFAVGQLLGSQRDGVSPATTAATVSLVQADASTARKARPARGSAMSVIAV